MATVSLSTTRSSTFVATLVFLALPLPAAAAQTQGVITWTVKDLDKPSADISTQGELCIAANLGPEVCEKVVGGVHFMADRSHWTRKTLVRNGPSVRGVMYFPEFRSGGFVLKMPYNRTASGIGARHATDAAYDFILKDGRHWPGSSSGQIQCAIEGLTGGNTYEIQIFWGSKNNQRMTEWDNGAGGRSGQGGILLRPNGPHGGQVATGRFVALASGTQIFTNYQDPTANPPTFASCDAIQIRDITAKPLTARATYYGEGTPGTNTQPLLGGSKCSPAISLAGHPKINTPLKLTVENSQDAASVAILVFGLTPTKVPVVGGELLVVPLALWPLPMPQPASPYVHDHELQVPLILPTPRPVIYVQAAQLDPGAPGGWSFTPGLKIEPGL